MNKLVTVVSMFRDSIMWKGRKIDHVGKYMSNMVNQSIGIDNMQFLWLEGDSSDNTYEELEKIDCDKHLFNFSVNDEYVGLVNSKHRMKKLSILGDELIRRYREIPPTPWVFYIESDIIINNPHLIMKLMSRAKDIIAPMVMTHNNLYSEKGFSFQMSNVFYDTWGFIDMDDIQFQPHEPYSLTFNRTNEDVVEIHSCGTALMMRDEFWRNGSFGDNALRAFCEDARTVNKAQIFVDRSLSVIHPYEVYEGRRI